MSVPLWAIETAEAFWAEAGSEAGTPRVLRRTIQLTLPLGVVPRSGLTTARLDSWLREWDIVCSLRAPNRALRACLVCRAGRGLIFIDKDDNDAEQRYSLAHELAHYLREQWQPRRRAVAAFGPQVLEVLDGDRPPRVEESIQSILAQVPIGLQVHLMERTLDGNFADSTIYRAEREADLLAFELLAPSDDVLSTLQATPGGNRLAAVHHILTDSYGFPPHLAAVYARELVNGAAHREPPYLRNLGI